MGLSRQGHIMDSPILGYDEDNDGQDDHFGAMDILDYAYNNDHMSNRLYKVRDDGEDAHGFRDGSGDTRDYWYDANGNMTRDLNKGIGTSSTDGITYNHLNLPTGIAIGGGGGNGTINYIYDATGLKLKKQLSNGNSTEYAGNYIYENGTLQFFSHPEGYVNANGGGYDYVYQYKDHLGNVRVSYTDDPSNPGTPTIIEENNYYPFGGRHNGYNMGGDNSLGNDLAQMWKFGGKELDQSLGLETYDFGARNYDPWIGRWMNIDPLAEEMRRHSPYNYAFNNPLVFTDPDGMAPFTDLFDKDGKKIGDDGVDNGVNVVVNNEELAEQAEEVFKEEGTVDLLDDRFSFNGDDISLLPSDTALGEALNVLDRTIENGGLSEESSLVFKDGTIIQGSTGSPVQLGVDTEARASLPGLFPGTTPADVEVSIHSHPTEAKVVGGQVFGGNATVASGTDATTFTQYKTNIIVGPLGQATATQGVDKQTGQNTTTINKTSNGVVIFNNRGTTPSFQFSRRIVNKMIGN